MKIILSRKGFDSSNGGCPSPIMPDGTLLSMPIPSYDDDSFYDISWKGTTYADILEQICPKKTYYNCHIDPDIRNNRIEKVQGWRPAFGQTGSAQGILSNAGVEPGDLFLFFGWFRQVEHTDKGYRFAAKNQNDFYYGNEYSFLMPEHIYGNKKNCAKGKGLYYAGIWQEQVVYESEGLMEWVKQVLM